MQSFFQNVLTEVLANSQNHSPEKEWYKQIRAELYENLDFGSDTDVRIALESIGDIHFPQFNMGKIGVKHLFGLDEIIIFALYKSRKFRGLAIDLGANLGLHSIVLSRLGYQVVAYEPDKKHFLRLQENLKLNSVEDVVVMEAAVGTKDGNQDFIRVIENTTGSHLVGSSGKVPYGEVEVTRVQVINFRRIIDLKPSIIKIDVEGYEANLILQLEEEDFESTSYVLEVGNKENAHQIFEHLKNLKIRAFSQKNSWRSLTEVADVPFSYKEGSLYIPSSVEQDSINYLPF